MKITVQSGQLVLAAVLPLPPSINSIYHPRATGGIYKDPKVTAYALKVNSCLNYPQNPWRTWQEPMAIRALRERSELRMDFELWEFFKSNDSDIDNRVKALQDILCFYLAIDDSRIMNARQHKRVHKECSPCVFVKLSIAEISDIWAEQAELDNFMQSLLSREERGHASQVTTIANAIP